MGVQAIRLTPEQHEDQDDDEISSEIEEMFHEFASVPICPCDFCTVDNPNVCNSCDITEFLNQIAD